MAWVCVIKEMTSAIMRLKVADPSKFQWIFRDSETGNHRTLALIFHHTSDFRIQNDIDPNFVHCSSEHKASFQIYRNHARKMRIKTIPLCDSSFHRSNEA